MKSIRIITLFLGILLMNFGTFFDKNLLLGEFLVQFKIASIIFLTISGFLGLYNSKVKIKDILLIMALLAVGASSSVITGEITILQFLLVYIAVWNADFKSVLKIDLISKIIVVLINICSYAAGLTNALAIHRTDGTFRWSFGFFHPNTFAMVLLFAYIEFVYLAIKKKWPKRVLLITGLLLEIPILFAADSRLSAGIVAIVILYIIAEKYIVKIFNNKIIAALLRNSFVLLCVLSLAVTTAFSHDNNMLRNFNGMLSNRIQIQKVYMDNYSIGPLGNTVDYKQSLDNFYLRYLLNYGYIVIILYGIIIRKDYKEATERSDYLVLLILATMPLACLAESTIMHLSYNIFPIYYATKSKTRRKIDG